MLAGGPWQSGNWWDQRCQPASPSNLVQRPLGRFGGKGQILAPSRRQTGHLGSTVILKRTVHDRQERRKFGRTNQWTAMSSSSNTSIAKKARTKAEADFATWLMMAKLGGFDDLPSNAQNFLTNYRARLETMSEADSTALAVREVYSAYYSEMGGVGAAPEPKARTPTTEGKVVRFQRPPEPQPGLSVARHSTRPMIRKSLPALLIFTSMVALIVAYRFLTQ